MTWYGHMESDRVIRDSLPQELQTNYVGTFLDVGAAHPTALSNSCFFRQRGWKIISVEPNPRFCQMYRDKGLTIHEFAAADMDEEQREFYVWPWTGEYLPDTEGMPFSSLGLRVNQCPDPNACEKIVVKTRRLDTILKENYPNLQEIDVLSIDIEGWELDALDGLSIERYRPKVICIEEIDDHQQAYGLYMHKRGYKKHCTNANDGIYVPR
jgi:FkbM family methyltransferase